MTIQHPLKAGISILSVQGEWDNDENDNPRHTGPNALGTVIDCRLYPGQGWTYGIHFPNDTWVFIDQQELDSPTNYTIQGA